MSEVRRVYGGIYIDGSCESVEQAEEFGIYLGKEKTVWFENHEHAYLFDQLTECGGIHNLKYIDGYSFGINKRNKTWHVKDTGHKNCKHILFEGTYEDERFSDAVSKYIKSMTG